MKPTEVAVYLEYLEPVYIQDPNTVVALVLEEGLVHGLYQEVEQTEIEGLGKRIPRGHGLLRVQSDVRYLDLAAPPGEID